MKIIESTIEIGLDKSFEILHASDTHVALADERDNQRKIDLANQRFQYFDYALDNVKFMSEYAKKHNLPIMHTGDFMDFVSEKNLDAVKDFVNNNDVFFSAGNHEFSLYVGEAFEDAEYRNISLEKVQSAFKNNIRFDVREICGVNFVAIDNSYYLFEQEHEDYVDKVNDHLTQYVTHITSLRRIKFI